MADSPSAPTLASLRNRAKELLELARDSSESARAALASGLYDMSVASANVPTEDRTLAADIVLEIIKGAATSIRHQLADRLARDPKAPKALVLALAHDEITVAFPVLIESPLLDEADLLEILGASPPEHRLGVLQREQLSETLANAVVETRNPQVMRWLVENPGAKIPPKAMEILVEAARAETSLQQALVYRADLPSSLATKMHSYLPDALRQELVAQHNVKPPAGAAPVASIAPLSPLDDKRALALAHGLRDKGDLTVDLLVKTIRAGKALEFEAQFACFNRVSLAAARQILSSPTGEALAVALKAQGVAKGTFATIFILTRKARDPGADLSAALARASEAFDRLTSADARTRFAALRSAHPEDSAA